MKKRNIKDVIIMICLFLLLGMNVFAASDIKVVGTSTNEKDISLYVKGLDLAISGVECQIGTKPNQQVTFENAADMEYAPKTLIMVDNSLSITEGNREKIYSFLMAFVDDKEDREQIAIAVFDEELKKIVDYTADEQVLENAVESLTYQNQETYLTDVLYDVIEEEQLGTEDCYKRIIIISDGVDNKAIGYTKDELYSLIKEKSYPIYTIGCVYKSNDEQLKNMFAISRMTGAKDFLLDEIENIETLVDEIMEDSQAVHFNIVPDAGEMDGSNKNILLTVQTAEGEQKIEASVKMPFQAELQEEVSDPEPISEEETEKIEEQETEYQEAEYQETTASPISYIIIVVIVAVLIVVGIILFVLFHKKSEKNEKNVSDIRQQAPSVSSLEDRNETLFMSEDSDKTMLMSDDNDKTQLISEDDAVTQLMGARQYTLYLTDEKNPSRTFQAPIDGVVIIGRNMREATLCIDYDKSISGRHCQISERDGKFYVKDLQSSNGTVLNGERIVMEKEIYSGCVLVLGRLRMKVEIR